MGERDPLLSALGEGSGEGVDCAVWVCAAGDAVGETLPEPDALCVARAEKQPEVLPDAEAASTVGLADPHSEAPADRDSGALWEAAGEGLPPAEGDSRALGPPLPLMDGVSEGDALLEPAPLPLCNAVPLAVWDSDETGVALLERVAWPETVNDREGAPLPDGSPESEASVLTEALCEAHELEDGLREGSAVADTFSEWEGVGELQKDGVAEPLSEPARPLPLAHAVALSEAAAVALRRPLAQKEALPVQLPEGLIEAEVVAERLPDSEGEDVAVAQRVGAAVALAREGVGPLLEEARSEAQLVVEAEGVAQALPEADAVPQLLALPLAETLTVPH